MRRAVGHVVVACAIGLLAGGCAELRYRAATKDLKYHLAPPMVLSCWVPRTSPDWRCEDEKAGREIQACATVLQVDHESVLVENIRRELAICMKDRGWLLIETGRIVR